MLYLQISKHETNLSQIVLTGECLAHLTIGISFTCNINQELLSINIIRDNMSSLVQSSKYGAINTYDKTTNGYYVIKFISEAYTL